jgi:hypothetical protein
MQLTNTYHLRYDAHTCSYVELSELEFVNYLRPLLSQKIKDSSINSEQKTPEKLSNYSIFKLIEICMLSGMSEDEILLNPDWFSVLDSKGIGWSFAHQDFINPSQDILMAFARKILEFYSQPLTDRVNQEASINFGLHKVDFKIELPLDLFTTIRSVVKLPILVSSFQRPDKTCFLFVYYSDRLKDFTTEVIWYGTVEFAKLRSKMLATA